MTDPVKDFSDALASAGYRLPAGKTINPDDKWHRLLYLDEKTSSGRYRLAVMNDGFAIGSFGSDKDPEGFHKWHLKLDMATLTPEDRQRMREESEELKARKERELEARQDKIAKRLAGVIARAPLADEHLYLEKKKIAANGIRIRAKNNQLLIPMYSGAGEVVNIQRINANGWKGFFKGARVNGACYPMGAFKEGVLVICEGFATGATVHEVTGLPVRVAFNTANLKHVAVMLKAKYPDARILFCADNDQWTFKPNKKPEGVKPPDIRGDEEIWNIWRDEDMLWNPGVERAQQAAAAIGGALVIWPEFTKLDDKPTDFNDMRAVMGDDSVRARIMGILSMTAPTEEPPTVSDARDDDSYATEYSQGVPAVSNGDLGMSFRVLGYNDGLYFYFPFSSRQIVALSAASHTMQNLLQLDELHHWEKRYRDGEGKLKVRHNLISLYSSDALMTLAKARGVFKEEDRIRGCGAWVDDGRIILHCGDCLYEEGERRSFEEVNSYYTYIASVRLLVPAPEPMSNRESAMLRAICEAVSWENPLSGSLLAGWLVVAPICAALEYRPHIYITGEAESGKSTVMDRIIKRVLGRFALTVDGKTTEPSIREQMGYDARPLIFDEAEPSPTMEAVIGLARLASTGGMVKKFNQPVFKARFCACFSAINPPVNKTADESRISFMVIKKNRKSTALADYDKLLDMIEDTITPEFSSRLLARTLTNMNQLLANIRTFQRAVRHVTGGARASQQIGTMLAGLYLLGRTDAITRESAEEWVARWNWEDHAVIDQQGDPMRLVQHIAESLVKGADSKEYSIADLVETVYVEHDAKAERVLGHYGIRVKGDRVLIASTSHNLSRLLRDTEWQMKWSRTLADVPGAVKEKSEYFSRAVRTSGVSLPVHLFMSREDEEIPFDEAVEF